MKDFVYEDKEWITTLQQIMLQGWKYNVSDLFIQKIKNVLGLQTAKLKSNRAYDVLCGLVDELYNKNKDSDIVFMMYGELKKPFIPSINKHSWDFAFMLKLLKDKDLYKKYLIFIDKIIDEKDVSVFKKLVVEVFGDNWKNNADDILWFLAGKELLSLEKNETKFKINKRLMQEFITKNQITTEVKIILAPNTNLDINTNKSKNSFFSKDIVKKRYKNLFNSNHFKFYSSNN